MKIYDCFTFFNELDTLEIRLNVLNDQVDYFVLVEATKTHSGEKKNLYFDENKARFSKFLNKIKHVVVDDMPEIINGDRWPSDYFQRNAIMRGLSGCNKEDMIIISDLDEIPNLENIEEIKNILIKNMNKKEFFYNFYYSLKKRILDLKTDSKIIKSIIKILNYFSIKSDKIVIFRQKLYYYYLNGFMHNHWMGSRAVLYRDLVAHNGSSPQQKRNTSSRNIVRNGGWHFSYLFGPEQISRKIKSITHSEFDKPEYTDVQSIKERIDKGEWLFGKEFKIKYVQIDSSYPKYILDNIKKYDSHIKHK